MGILKQENMLSDCRLTPGPGASPAAGSKEDLAQRAFALTASEFVQERIVPSVPALGLDRHVECSTSILQNNGTGRLTLRYTFGTTVVIAKVFSDHLGAQSFETNVRLWNSGFKGDSLYQVPEPIVYFPDVNLLLMRQVPGIPIAVALEPHRLPELIEYCRRAAHWLTALHRMSFVFGEVETEVQSLKLFRLATRLIKASALQSEQVEMMRDLFDSISQRIVTHSSTRSLVQTHGRYHHDHVFVSAEATVVIDLDRCCPSDPAKDVAEFISVLRATAFKRGLDMDYIGKATDAFLREYLAVVPEAEASLGCYWATAVLHDLLSGIKKCRAKANRTWEEMQQFYLAEINRALGITS